VEAWLVDNFWIGAGLFESTIYFSAPSGTLVEISSSIVSLISPLCVAFLQHEIPR
jgi:hypothetical protein